MTWTDHGPNPKFHMNDWTNTIIQYKLARTECKRCMMHHINTAPACHGVEVHACYTICIIQCKIYIMYVLACIWSCIMYFLCAWQHHGDMVYSQYEICNIAEPHGSICGGRSTLSSRSMLVVAAFSSACLCARSAAASSARRATSAMIPRLSNLHYPSPKTLIHKVVNGWIFQFSNQNESGVHTCAEWPQHGVYHQFMAQTCFAMVCYVLPPKRVCGTIWKSGIFGVMSFTVFNGGSRHLMGVHGSFTHVSRCFTLPPPPHIFWGLWIYCKVQVAS